jgi:hypothetical protein
MTAKRRTAVHCPICGNARTWGQDLCAACTTRAARAFPAGRYHPPAAVAAWGARSKIRQLSRQKRCSNEPN